MAKYTLVILVVALSALCYGFPTRENDIASAAAAGRWDEVSKLLMEQFNKSKYNLNPLAEVDLLSHKPRSGELFYGEAETQFHSLTNRNGEVSEQSGGHKVVNDNGNVTEFNFQPTKPNYERF